MLHVNVHVKFCVEQEIANVPIHYFRIDTGFWNGVLQALERFTKSIKTVVD